MTADRTNNTNSLSLSCSILIVGSLLWNKDKAGIRAKWRDDRLDLAAATRIHVPLRYGRRSQGWGNTFTMVLDAMAPSGKALLVPCEASVHSYADLLEEIRLLWSAEDSAPPIDRFYKSWGCVAALFGSKAAAVGFPEQWRATFQAAPPPNYAWSMRMAY